MHLQSLGIFLFFNHPGAHPSLILTLIRRWEGVGLQFFVRYFTSYHLHKNAPMIFTFPQGLARQAAVVCPYSLRTILDRNGSSFWILVVGFWSCWAAKCKISKMWQNYAWNYQNHDVSGTFWKVCVGTQHPRK